MGPKSKFPRIRLRRGGGEALYRQIESAIVAAIRGGDLPAGSRLPAGRDLAGRLGVNRTTVTAAYRSLEAGGWVASRVGRGTTVTRATGPAAAGRRRRVPGPARYSQAIRTLRAGRTGEEAASGDGIDFSRLLPDERLFPVRPFRRAVHDILDRNARELLQYGPPQGHPDLRRVLAERLARHGLPADPDRLLIVSGAQQGLDLVFRALLDPGDAVIVESPTYSQVLPLLRLHRARIAGVPMTGDGVDLDALEPVLAAESPRLIYTMPTLHNPTGVTTTGEHRDRLIEIAYRYRVPILEDGFEEGFGTGGKSAGSLKSRDPAGLVIQLGTFSKGLFPGLRIGWLLAEPPILRAAAAVKACSDYHTSLLTQAAVAEFCRRGHYEAHQERLQRAFRRRLRVALRAMREAFPPEARWNAPGGGYCIWVELPDGIGSERLARRAARRGVRIAPGRPFFADQSGDRYFRISISRVDEKEIRDGMERLGGLLREMVEAREEAPAPAGAAASIPYI